MSVKRAPGNQEILDAFLRGDRSVDSVLIDRLWAQIISCARKVATDLGQSQYSQGMGLDPEEATNRSLTEFLETMAKQERAFRDFDWAHLIRYLRRRVTLRILDQSRRWHTQSRLGGQMRSFEVLVNWVDDQGESMPFDPASPSQDQPDSFVQLNNCLDRLSPNEREMFLQKHLDETTQANLALDYMMPQGTLAVRLMRIAARLRDCLKRGGITSYQRLRL